MDEIAALKFELLAALRASTPLAAFVGNRIFDVSPQAPNLPTSPYIRFGPFTSQDDGPECFETYDIAGQIDVFSWGEGEAASTMEASKISAIVKDIVNGMQDETSLPEGYVLTEIRFRSKRVITASDGETKHVPVTIAAIVDKT